MKISPAYTSIVEVYETLVVDDVYADWAEFIVDAWASSGGSVTHVLDIGCGTGLLAEQLLAQGLVVRGIDASDEMLTKARIRLGDAADLSVSALPTLTVEGTFDAAASTFDTLNYVVPADLTPSMVAIAGALRDGAVFVFDVHTDAMMAFSADNPTIIGERAGWSFELLTTVDESARSCISRFTARPATDDEARVKEFAEEHTQYFHSVATLENALVAAGFEVLAVTDEYSSSPVTAQTLRATWTARLITRESAPD